MSVWINQVIQSGVVVQKQELRYITTKVGEDWPITGIRITNKRPRVGKRLVKEKLWIWCTFTGRLAEIAHHHLENKDRIIVFGRLVSRRFTDRRGIVRWTTQIMANTFQMIPPSMNQRNFRGGRFVPKDELDRMEALEEKFGQVLDLQMSPEELQVLNSLGEQDPIEG